MSRTSLLKAKEAVWVPCPIPGFDDEQHLIRPSTRGMLYGVRDKSQVKEWERGQIVRNTDPNLFDEEYIDALWADCKNTGLQYEDGRIEDPVVGLTREKKVLLINGRPIEFLLWIQRTADELAAQTYRQIEQHRESFRGAGEVPTGSPESQL